MTAPAQYDVIVIGGGPAGSTVGRLLARWGHRVLVLARPRDPQRGLAESIPPSARKLLSAIGVLDAVERGGFPRNRGNAVWWGESTGRDESFDGEGHDAGFQVFRPDFDALLLGEAFAAGADVRRWATVRAVTFHDGAPTRVDFEWAGERLTALAAYVVDASGRAGVVARTGLRRYQSDHRMQAYLGMWRRDVPWADSVQYRTFVETYEDGWAWSLGAGDGLQQVAVMLDAAVTRTTRGSIEHAYRAELAKTRHVAELTAGADLERVWACDASMYASTSAAGPSHLLVGDASCCIDPLSSFGVKKALASGWLGSVALHTALTDPDRRTAAFEHYARREREVYANELARTREYARQAGAHHQHPFWTARGTLTVADEPAAPDVDRLLHTPAVGAAHDALRSAQTLTLRWQGAGRLVPHTVVRGNEIVVEPALRLPDAVVRYLSGVDLVALGQTAPHHHTVPDLYDAYCRRVAPVPLPDFLGALSLLVAEGALAR